MVRAGTYKLEGWKVGMLKGWDGLHAVCQTFEPSNLLTSKPALTVVLLLVLGVSCYAQSGVAMPKIEIGLGQAKGPEQVSSSIQILLILTVLSLAPALLIRLALFLTFFTMAPVLQRVNDTALQPYVKHQISFDQATQNATGPLKTFMLKQTRPKDIGLFVSLSPGPRPQTERDLSMHVLIPAFLISELKTAFTIGFVIFIPFLVIDMVVSVILMSMGMMMLPPVLISLPFKILLFVLVDGWHLLARSLAMSFM
jgi:flagellar biosynthetic protein FliP